MSKSKLADLNEYLFEALDRITNDELEGDALDAEIKRTEAITDVAEKIIENAGLQLKALTLVAENGNMEAEKSILRLTGSDD